MNDEKLFKKHFLFQKKVLLKNFNFKQHLIYQDFLYIFGSNFVYLFLKVRIKRPGPKESSDLVTPTVTSKKHFGLGRLNFWCKTADKISYEIFFKNIITEKVLSS